MALFAVSVSQFPHDNESFASKPEYLLLCMKCTYNVFIEKFECLKKNKVINRIAS